MIVIDEEGHRVEVPDTPEWTQSPLIGLALLAVVLWLSWLMSGAPLIVWVP